MAGAAAATASPPSDINIAAAVPRADAVWSNWAGTVRFVPRFFHTPRNERDISAVLRFAREKGHRVRVAGMGHSPGPIVEAREVPQPTPANASSPHGPSPIKLRPPSSHSQNWNLSARLSPLCSTPGSLCLPPPL